MPQTITDRCLCAAALLALTLTTGCHISSRGKDGREDVDIRTPIGGLAVRTDPAAVLGKIGLPAYPGAVPEKNEGTDKDSADVNLSFGNFRLRVLALGFQTTDDHTKVETFYRKALQQYSDVIACRDETPVGEPARTGLGLTCKGDRHVHTDLHSSRHHEDDDSDLTLKAGSSTRQHIVSMKSQGDGTHFTLVALDLPGDATR